jgi:hypothetical protein
MCVLALDIATKTGWALFEEGMTRPHMGSLTLKTKNQGNGFAGENLRKLIAEKHEIYGIEYLVFESQHIGKKINPQLVYMLIGLGMMTEWMAHRMKAQCFTVDIGTWRKHFIGTGGLGRDAAKKKAIDMCRSYGWAPADDNEADACGILDYFLSLPAIAQHYTRPWRDQQIMQGFRV